MDFLKFYNLCFEILSSETAKYNLVLGILHDFKNSDEAPYFYASHGSSNEEKSFLVANLRSGSYYLLPARTQNKEAAHELLSAYLKNNNTGEGFLLGTPEDIFFYKEILETELKANFQLKMNQMIYENINPTPPSLPPKKELQLKLVKEEQADLAKVFLEEFHIEIDSGEAMPDYKEFALKRIASSQLYFLYDEEEALTIALFSRDLGKSAVVSGIYTPKKHRKNGYASLATYQLTKKLFEQGKDRCFLYTDLSNQSSNKIYKDIGYKEVSPSVLYKWTTKDS